MKANIHPEYIESTVECACGNTFKTRSTISSIKLEICSACHPFFTGTQKLIDTAGRVDRFRAKVEKASAAKASKKSKKNQSEKPAKATVEAEDKEAATVAALPAADNQ